MVMGAGPRAAVDCVGCVRALGMESGDLETGFGRGWRFRWTERCARPRGHCCCRTQFESQICSACYIAGRRYHRHYCVARSRPRCGSPDHARGPGAQAGPDASHPLCLQSATCNDHTSRYSRRQNLHCGSSPYLLSPSLRRRAAARRGLRHVLQNTIATTTITVTKIPAIAPMYGPSCAVVTGIGTAVLPPLLLRGNQLVQGRDRGQCIDSHLAWERLVMSAWRCRRDRCGGSGSVSLCFELVVLYCGLIEVLGIDFGQDA